MFRNIKTNIKKLPHKMYKQIILLIITVLLASCRQEKTDKLPNSKDELHVSQDDKTTKNDSISGFINPELGLFSFKFNVDYTQNQLTDIRICKDGTLFQVIDANKELLGYEFKLIDWNFDGYKDITVLYNCGIGGSSYYIWNYSPKSKKFIYNKILSEVIGLKIDYISKNIIIHYRAGYAEESIDTFEYTNDKLTFIKGLFQERWTDQDGVSWQKKTYKRVVNNALEVSVDSVKLRYGKCINHQQ
jgi:hypothetical protein